jgi:RnfABCDGE-type electron transport complex G subunit
VGIDRNDLKNKVLKPALILAAIALISAFLLSHINKNTSKVIGARKLEKQKEAVKNVLSGYSNIIEEKAIVDGKTVNYWVGTKEIKDNQNNENKDNKESNENKENKENKIEKAYAMLASEPGYGGNIDTMVGFNEEFKVLEIIILHQTETPGLGTVCVEAADDTTLADVITGKKKESKIQRPWFQEQFAGLSMNEPVRIEQRGDWTPQMRDELLQRNAITSLSGATVTSRAVLRSVEYKANQLKKILTEKNAEQNKKDEKKD